MAGKSSGSASALPVLLARHWIGFGVKGLLFFLYPWEVVTLDEIREDALRWKKEKPYSSAVNQILRGFNECVSVLASDIGYEKEPVEELLDKAVEGIEASIADLKKTSSGRLDAFNQWLIEQKIIESNDGTVVRL